jgi:hypothetical protein
MCNGNGNGNHAVDPPAVGCAEHLKMSERNGENVRNGTELSPCENNDTEESVEASGTSSRIPTLISAAIRVWELKRGIR